MTKKIVTLVRHGRVDGPAALYGCTDIALSEDGYKDLGRTLKNLHTQTPINQLISSPRLRCLQVAQEFSAQHQIPIYIQENFQEMDFGIWDGIPFDKLGDEWKNLESFWQAPHNMQPPGGESLIDFAVRIINSWQSLTSHTKPGHDVIICHGGVIRILIAHILQLDWRNAALFKQLHIDYASHTRIEIDDITNPVPIIKWIGVMSE